MERRSSLALVVFSAACFGTLAVLAPLAYAEGARPLPMLVWRFATVTLLMAGYLLVRSPRELVVDAGDLGRFSLLALTGYCGASMCFFYALRYADASVVAVLLYTYPAMVAIGAWPVYGERPTGQRVVGILLAFAGCALVVGVLSPEAAVRPLGIVLGLGAALGYATYSLLSHRWLHRRPRMVLMTYMFAISAVVLGVLALVQREDLGAAQWAGRPGLLLAAIVVFPTFLAVITYLEGMKGIGAPRAAVISTVEPLFTIVLAAAFLGERLTAAQWLGAALVIGGIVLSERGVATAPAEENLPTV